MNIKFLFRKAAVTALLTALPCLLAAQIELEVIQNPADVNVEVVTAEEGLFQANMTDLHQDSYGFLWVATLYGLKQYDGYRFRTFVSDHMDSTSLPDDRINTIFEDHAGSLWISTQAGLSRYNRGSENFTTFYPDKENFYSPDNIIYFTREDAEGLLWTFTEGGLFSLKGDEFRSYKQDSIKPFKTNFRFLSILSQICFKEDKKGDIWISATIGGLKRYEREKDKFQHYKYDPEQKNGIGSDLAVGVNIDKQDSVWVSTWGEGLYKLRDEEKGIFKHYGHDPDDPGSIIHDQLEQVYTGENGDLWIPGRSGFSKYNFETDDFTSYYVPFDPDPYDYENTLITMSTDKSGRMWMTAMDGLYCFDPGSGSITHFLHEQDNMIMDDMADVVNGYDGITWFIAGTGALYKIDSQNKPFRSYFRDPEKPKSLMGNEANSFCEDKRGGIWIGTYLDGLSYWDPGNDDTRFYNYKNIPSDQTSVSSNNVTVIYQDKENTLWVGTGQGLNKLVWSGKFDRDHKPVATFVQYFHYDSIPGSISDNNIEDIMESSKGDLWITTWSGGVDVLDRKTNEFRHLLKDPDDFQETKYLFQHNPTVLHEDKQGYFWIGTFNGGLFRYQPADSSLTSYRNIPGDSSSISDNCIRHIAEDNWGRLWLGTMKGLNLFNPKAETFILFDKKKGFKGEMLKGLLADDHGNLWISYDGGITKFILTEDDACLQNPVFYDFDQNDGILGSYNRWAYYKSPSGLMYFGGVKGFNVFHPDSIKINSGIPPVYITSFSNHYERKFFDRPVYELDEISIQFRNNVFSFDFVSLNYTNSKKNQYAYMLEGFDEDWIYCGTEREAKYTNISPGTYTFRVKGSNNDGIWNEEGASIQLVIRPPWYRTILAYFIYGVLLIGLIYGYIRRRTWMLRKERDELDRMVKERTAVIEEQNEEIKTMNAELEEQKEEVMATNAQLEEQKEELEQQKEELLQQKEELQVTLDRLKEAQARLIQSEKMAALGGLVAGVAHEINTPVGISVTAASTLMEESQRMAEKYKENKISRAEFKDFLNDANQSARLILSNMERAAEMVQSFKQVSADQSTAQKRKFLLKSYIQDVIRSLYPRLKKSKIKIHLDMDEKIELDSFPGAFSQIITNLVLNSLIHGFDEGEDGRIDILAEQKKGQLSLEYRDDGKGIEASSLEHVFEPFYTTNKKTGTGLGLHIVYNLVTQKLNGTIECESDRDAGTKFIIEMSV